MTADDFVNAVKLFVLEPAGKGVLKAFDDPPGRSPTAKAIAASNWYRTLPDEHRSHVADAVQDAAHAAAFGLLCVIDGVRVIESGAAKSEFRLICVSPDGTETVLNADDGDFLHDILNAV